MVAQNWIKALNSRLSETPNIGGKVGYGALILLLGAFAAVLVLLTLIIKAANAVLRAATGAIWNTNFSGSAYGEAGYRHGHSGFGYYDSDGILVVGEDED